jgi:hypothetical protein
MRNNRKLAIKRPQPQFGLPDEASQEKWDSEANKRKWAIFKRLQRQIYLTMKRIHRRNFITSLNLPKFLTIISPYIRYRNLHMYREGQWKSESTHNYQRFVVTWNEKMEALFFAAMTVYGIDNCDEMVKCVHAFDMMDSSILHAHTYRSLKVSCKTHLTFP